MQAAKHESPAVDLRDYLTTIKRRKLLIFYCTVIFTAAAFAGIALLKDEYKATTTILVDPQKIPERYVNATVSADPTDRLNTISQEVLSTSRLLEIINRMGLYPELRKSTTRDDIVEYMKRKISIQVKQSSGQGMSAFTITYAGSNPETVAQVTNQLAGTFIEWNLKAREQLALGTTEFLDSQLKQARDSLEEQEVKMREFKMQHLGETPDQVPVNLQNLSRLQVQLQANMDSLNRLEGERMLLSQTPDTVTTKVVDPSSLSEHSRLELERRQVESELWDLRRKYTASHPDVQGLTARLKRIEAQIAALPPTEQQTSSPDTAKNVRLQVIQRELGQLREEQKHIQSQIAGYQTKLDAAPVREQQLTGLTRNYDMSRQHYASLLDKAYSAEMAAELERKQKGERFTILDPASVPEKPYKPKRVLLMASAPFGSLAFAIGLALLLEMAAGTLSAERELRQLLPGAQVLAFIPAITTAADIRRRRWAGFFAISSALIVVAAVGTLFWRIRPIL